jgi:hypothetical protein
MEDSLDEVGETPAPDSAGTFSPGEPPSEDAPKRGRGRPPGAKNKGASRPRATTDAKAAALKAKRTREEKELYDLFKEGQETLVNLECWFTGVELGKLTRNANTDLLGLSITDGEGVEQIFVNYEIPERTLKMTAKTAASLADTPLIKKGADIIGPLAPYAGLLVVAYLLNVHVSGMIAVRKLVAEVAARQAAVDATPAKGPGTEAAKPKTK